jgi:hypothetical protein
MRLLVDDGGCRDDQKWQAITIRPSNSMEFQMECPVCGAPAAKDITPHSFLGRSIRCGACGDYDISISVCDSGTLQSLDSAQRLEALNSAKRFAARNKRPIITSYDI